MSQVLRRTTFTLAALLLLARPALASSTTYRSKGGDIGASFTILTTKACGTSTALVQTFVGAQTFETSLRVKGVLTTTLQTLVQVTRFDFCTHEFTFDFGTFAGGQISMSSLTSGVIAGHYVLANGTVVDLNLTVTGSTTTEQGVTMRRENLGNVMIIQHLVASWRSATVAGTGTIDGVSFGTAQMTDTDGFLARTTGGEITVLKP